MRKQGDGWRSFWYRFSYVLLKTNSAPAHAHRLGLKFSLYDQNSNPTYFGLTESPRPTISLDTDLR
ncbi:MAG: hypothetical protein ACP5U2_04665 [Bryobacteraceae bacterium]